MSESVVSLRSVTKTYGLQRGLDNVSFDLYQGSIIALLGPNGAGKTTTVRLLLGLAAPTSGSVRIFGSDPCQSSVRIRVGAMLQVGMGSVPAQLTVREHFDLFRSYYPKPLAMSEIMSITGLEGLERRRFGKLSGGQKQRVMFGLALCGDPDLLFLDEPTVGMDVEARRALWDSIQQMAQRGKTILLATHYLEEADRLADRVLVLQAGKIVADGTPEEMKNVEQSREIRCRTALGAEVLMAFPSVSNVRREGASTIVSSGDPDTVVRAILDNDPSVRDLEIRGVGLEEAFVALTARMQAEKVGDK